MVGKVSKSGRANAYLLKCVDAATRRPEAIPIPGLTTAALMVALEMLIWWHGAPQCIWSDRGLSLRSADATEVYGVLENKKLDTSAYQHEANGCCERSVAALKTLLGVSLAGGALHECFEVLIPPRITTGVSWRPGPRTLGAWLQSSRSATTFTCS